MTIYEDAFRGVLNDTSISTYTGAEINSIGTIKIKDGKEIKVTPLAAACYGGHPNVVKLLLHYGALPNKYVENNTPLYFTIINNATAKKQSGIIEELVEGGADVDLACDQDKNTPLMVALNESEYEDIIIQLRKISIDDNIKNTYGDTLESLTERRKNKNMRNRLLTETSPLGITQCSQSTAAEQITVPPVSTASERGGIIMKSIFGRANKKSDITEEMPHPTTIDELVRWITNYVGQREKLAAFFPQGEQLFKQLANKAAAVKADTFTDLGKPENIERLTILSLYDLVLYLDDSGSMNATDAGKSTTRFRLLAEIVKRVASIATKIVPDNQLTGIQLRFINSTYSGKKQDSKQIFETLMRTYPSGGTGIGTGLRTKVLEPMVYNQLSAEKTDINPIPLKRPLLVCIITDGSPSNEDSYEMQGEILRCRDRLRLAGLADDAVTFWIAQIGQAAEATEFLDELKEESRIEHTTHICPVRLDDLFEEYKENDRRLEVELLNLLTKGLRS